MKDLIKRAQNELAHSAERENLRSKSKTKARLLERLMLLMLALCLTAACSDKNEDETEKPDNPSGPTTPTGDEFTVAATGGTVEKGDISITIPSGTFTGETKVYVKEVTKGSVLNDNEVSTFYQVTLPLNTAKDMKVSVKSDTADDDVYLVVHAPVVSLHAMEEGYGDWVAEPTYSNGTYTATLPAFENPEETDNVTVSIGLAHMGRTPAAAQTRAASQNKVGNVAWHIDKGYKSTYNEARFQLFDEYIRKALTIIQGLGFKVEGDRDIPVYLADIKKDGKPEDGRFCQSPLGNQYSVLKINSRFKTMELTKEDDIELQRTIIHELLHYYQADYDPRWAVVKFRNVGDDELMMYESGAPWIEKLMVNEFSNDFVYTPMMTNDGACMRGFKNISDIYKGMNIKNARQAHAYSMPLLVEYITQKKGGDKSIVALYEGWKKEGKSSSVLGSGSITWDCYHRWATDIFGYGYNDFIDAACKGEVVPFFTADKFAPHGDSHQFRKDDTITLTSDCYPYGGVYNNLEIFNYTNEKGESSFKNKQLKIEQKVEGLTTTVYAFDTETENPVYIKTLGKATSNAPLVISDEKTLNSIHVSTKTKSGYTMYVVTTSEERDKTIKSEVVATLGDADHIELAPDELTFDATTGTKTVTVNTNIDELTVTPSVSWITAAYKKNNKQIEVTVEANTGKQREGLVIVKGGEMADTIKVTQQAATGEFDFTKCKAIFVGATVLCNRESNHGNGQEMYGYNYDEYSVHSRKQRWNVSVSQSGQSAHIDAHWTHENGFRKIDVSIDIDDVVNGKITNLTVNERNDWDGNDTHFYTIFSASNIPLPNSSGSTKGNQANGTSVNSFSQDYVNGWQEGKLTLVGSNQDEVTISFEQ